LAEEEEAFEKALRVLRERLNEYAVKHDLGDLLDVDEGKARGLAEAGRPELPEFSGASFGVKAYAALIAYRESALGRRGAYGAAARYWLEEGGSAWLLYYAPSTAYKNAEKARAERPAAVESMIAEALRRLFLRPGRDRYRNFVELLKGGELALELEKAEKTEKGTETYLFRLLKPEEDGGLEELGIKLRIEKVGEGAGIVYALMLDARWRGLFEQELGMVWKAAEELRGRLPVEDPFAYMAGWPASDVAIIGEGNERALEMGTSHLWQLAETHALFGWSGVAVSGVGLTLEGPKPQFHARTSLESLDEAVRRSAGLAVGRSAEGGWLKRLGVEAGSWDGLKQWVAQRWDIVVEAAVRRLGGDVREELEALKGRLKDDKVAREAIAPALLLIQAEKLGVNEESLRYFAAVISGAVGGDGYVSAALERVELASGSRAIALLWGAALAAYGIKAEVRGAGTAFQVVASGGDAVRLAGLYFLFGPPLLEGRDERVINHKLAEAVELGAKGALNIRWEGPRLTQSGIVAADLVISEGGVEVKYDVYLREKIALEFESSDRGRVELAARLLKLAGVSAEVKSKGGEGKWRVRAYTDMLAAGRKELRDAIADIVREALAKGWVDAGKAERWLDKLEGGLTLKEGWPKYHVGLTGSGALAIRYQSTNPGNIEREAKRLEAMGLEEGVHFAVKMPEGGMGYVSILREGLARAAWLSIHGSGDQQKLAAEFVDYILQRAEEEGEKVHEKALEVVEEGRARGSLRLAGFEREVDGRLVRVIGGGAEFDKGRSGKTLLRIKITAEVDGVRHDYTITFGRYGKKNMAVGYAYIREEADAERFSALVEALTGKRPRIRRMKDGEIVIECYEGHLGGLARYVELAEAIARWLAETGLPQRP
ncbi:MAG: PaRep2b protein, partial [Thermoproteus sp.]